MAVQPGRVGVAAAAGVAAAGHPLGEGAGQREAGGGQAGRDAGCPGLLGRGGRHAVIVAAGVPHLTHLVQYKYCMAAADVAGYVACWQPVSVPPQAACFARQVAGAAVPPTRARANALLRAAARLAASGIPLGLDPVPECCRSFRVSVAASSLVSVGEK